jgi:hypothetical protein
MKTCQRTKKRKGSSMPFSEVALTTNEIKTNDLHFVYHIILNRNGKVVTATVVMDRQI